MVLPQPISKLYVEKHRSQCSCFSLFRIALAVNRVKINAVTANVSETIEITDTKSCPFVISSPAKITCPPCPPLLTKSVCISDVLDGLFGDIVKV